MEPYEIKVLDYILNQEVEGGNKIFFTTSEYTALAKKGVSASDFVAALVCLDEAGYLKTHFYGHVGPETACLITLQEKALNHPQNRKQATVSDIRNSILVQVIIGVLTTVIGTLIVSLLLK